MKTNILKSFVAMLAIAATVCFAGCKDDESDADIIPNIAIAESTMSFTNAEETKTLALESNADWQAVVPESADWVTVNPMSGNGDKTVTIAVAENTTGKAREAEVKFSALHPTYGVYDTKKLTIIQSANENEVEEENAIYSDNFDKITAEQGEKGWPFLSADYTNPKGSAAANVTYNINNTKVSVRTSGKASNDSEYSSYKGSGVNKVFFGATPTSLVVENIALPADQQNYVLSFGANNYNQDAADNTFKNENFIVSLSKDGVAWTPIEYSFAEGVDLNGKWNLAEASLKLAEVPEALYIKFEAKISSTISIDDIKLSTGGAGEQEIVFAVVEDIEGTVTEILEAEQGANVKAIDATVVAVSSRAYLLTDGTSYILAYMSEDAPEVAVGDKVTVEGEMGSYGTPAVPQIVNPVATKTGTVENFAQPEAVVIDGAALDAYKDNFAIKYVKIADANLTKKVDGDKVYWNFSVEGATTATGSLAYPTAEMCPDSNHAKKVDIYGYVIYLSGGSSQYVNVIVTSIEVKGEGEEPAGPSEELGDDERYLSDEGLMITEDGDVKAYANAVTIEGKKYPALKLGTSKVVGSWTTAEVGVEGDYTLSFYAFGWSGKEAEVTVTVDEETVLTVQPIANANISGTATNFPVTVDQEKNFYSVELKGLTAESTITFATTEGKYRAVLFGIQLNQPETSDPVEMTPAAVAEGYQGAKVTWEAVEGAEAYVVSVVGNDAITPVEVAGDKTEAVITGLADARKYVFAVEAIDAEENLLGEGETAETEVWTLVNWEEPEFSLTLSEDKSKYVFMVGNLAEPNYIYAGGEIKIYKDGAAEPIYTLKNMTSDAYLNPSRGYGRWKVNEMNNRKDWTWYDASGTAMAEDANNDGNPDEWNSVPASFFAAGEYTLDYTIYYAVNINGTWATHDGSKFIPQDTEEGANFIYFEKGDNVLAADGNVLRQTKTNGETPVELATIEATLEFASVTAKAEGYQGAKIEWSAVETADAYKVVVNGTEVEANGELSHTVAPETLTDANEYTFTVKAYKGADVIAQGEATTQVFTLTNVVEPKVTFDGTTLHVGDCLDLHGVVVDIKVEFVKGGQTVHTATYTKDTQAYNAGGVAGYLNSGKCTVGLFDDFIPASATSQPNWVWNGTESATAPTFEPGTYSIKWTANYYTIVNAYWTTQVSGAYPKDQFKTKAEAVAANAGKARILFENPANDVLVQAIERTGTATDYVVEDPDAPELIDLKPEARAEGYQGAKIYWPALDNAKTYTVSVVGHDDIAAIEVENALDVVIPAGTLNDAQKYAFKVEAYDEEDNLIGEGTTAETEVYTLVNWEEPEFELVYNESADTYQLFARNVQEINYIYAGAEIKIYKDGAAEPIYTLKNWTDAGYLNNAATAGRWKLSDMTNRKDWTWYKGTTDEKLTSGEVNSVPASFFEPGVYTLDYTMHYALHVNAKWATHDGSWHDQETEEGATYLHFYEKANVLYTDGAVHREPKSNETAVALATIEAPAEPAALNAKAAIDEGTAEIRQDFLTDPYTDKSYANYNWLGLKSVNGLLGAVKLSWDAVEADKIVIAYNGQTVEVEGTVTEKVIEGLKTSPVEFTISAVKGSDTIAEEKVSSDVYVLPETDNAAVLAASYDEAKQGWKFAMSNLFSKQFGVYSFSMNVYKKGTDTAILSKDATKNGSNETYTYKAWISRGFVGPNNGGQAINTNGNDYDAHPELSDGVFKVELEPGDYEVRYTLNTWPIIFDAENTANVEGQKYCYKKALMNGPGSDAYKTYPLSGVAEFTVEAAPLPSNAKIAELTAAAKAAVGTAESASLSSLAGATYKGVVVGSNKNKNLNKQIAVVDNGATAEGSGIIIYENAAASTMEIGKTVIIEVTSSTTVNPFNGMLQIKSVNLTETDDAVVTPTPVELTAAQFNDGDYVGMYVKVTGLSYAGNSGDVWSAASTTSTNFKSGSENVVVRTYVGAAWAGDVISAAQTNGAILGVCGSYNGENQIFPQTAADVADFELTTPFIKSVTPASVSFAAEGGTEDLAVELLNATSVNVSGLTAPFSAEWDATNKVVKVTATENTSEEAVPAQTLTIAVEGGNSVAVEVSQRGVQTGAEPTVVTVDFTAAATYPSNFPSSKSVNRAEYTIGGYAFAFAGSTGNGYYKATNNGTPYLLFGKSGAYVELPAVEGKALTKVVAISRNGASGNVQVAVTNTAGTAIGGGTAKTWAQTSPYTYTYDLTGTAVNTVYRLTVKSAHNAQITKLELTYE